MKMTPLLWRVVSVLLCVAVVCWYTKGYVVSVESHQQAQRPVSSQDVGSQEESGENIHDRKFEESWPSPTSSPPEHELVIEDDQQTVQEVDTKQYAEAPEGEEPDVEVESEADQGIPQSELETEQSSENQHPEASTIQNQDSSSPLPSQDPLPSPAAELGDPPDILNLQDDVSNSVPDAASQVIDSDLPPADCEDENNPYESESSPPKVLEYTSNVHTAGTKTHTDLPPPPPSPQSSSTNHSPQRLEANTSHMLKEQDLNSPVTVEADSSVNGKDPEDIPTFDEWKRKVMEVEKEKTQSVHTSNNVASPPVKKIQKNFNNYASVECGAKILGANPEAKSTSAILKENMDLYMLNPCSNKIWFVIELCEPIQVKQLDIANFELFSSTPKDFLVSISDRYPTNKWLKLGTFHARDERTAQSFPLDEHLYAKYVKMFTKYIKVELVSHFGSEHFCPLSLIRVFGTSMVEEYEEIADPPERPDDQDDELDYPPGYASGEAKLSNNLIGSAKDVILNMVNNIAVNVLGGGPEIQGNLSSHEVNVTEPPPQLETTSNPTSTVPESEEEQVKPDPEVPAAEAPSPETPVPESSTSDESEQELPPVEEKIIIPLGKDEEEPISSTITLLEEEDLDEGKEKSECLVWEQETQTCSKPNPSCSSCSGAPSLQEYLHQQCSALLSNKWTCQTKHSKPMIPSIQKPVRHKAPPPSGHPGSQQPHTEADQPHERAPASEQDPGGGASSAVPSDPPRNTVASHEGSVSNSSPLEPSQTTNLPKPSTSDSSSAKPTPAIEMPQLSSETPGSNQDRPAEEKRVEPSASLSSSLEVQPSAGTPVEPAEETSGTGTSRPQMITSTETPDGTDQLQSLHPTTSSHVERPVDPSAVLQTVTPAAGVAPPSQEIATELEPSSGHSVITDTISEELSEDISASSSPPPTAPASSPTSPSLSDIYADPPNGTEQNGNPVHGSSQKESVFMRLNNRIKALEMNMSLSGRYLEQLSQRYRKQMEEMQKAFNKTIVKLQNTSRIAEEQDQRQTESIQSLQGQLENMTQLVLNLSVRIVQLKDEVTDRQNYLLLSLAFILCLGLLLWANYRRIGSTSPTTQPKPPVAKSYAHCCPDRQLTSCEEAGLKRSASYPLIHAESFQLAAAEGPGMLPEDGQSLCPANRKRRRRKVKPAEKVETLKPSFHVAPELCNGGHLCNGTPVTRDPTPLTSRLLQPLCRNSPSEGSSEGSSHSDDPSFCGMTAACGRICEVLPPTTSQPEKRASRPRRLKPGCTVVDLLTAPRRDRRELLPTPSFRDIASRTSEQNSGTFGANVVL